MEEMVVPLAQLGIAVFNIVVKAISDKNASAAQIQAEYEAAHAEFMAKVPGLRERLTKIDEEALERLRKRFAANSTASTSMAVPPPMVVEFDTSDEKK